MQMRSRMRTHSPKWTQAMRSWRTGLMVLVVACTILFLLVDRTIGQDTFTCARGLRVVTWNVAAINNNPFEYWITYPDTKYADLMNNVQSFVNTPGARDVAVHEVFSDAMAKELFAEMALRNVDGLPDVEQRWSRDYRSRKIISEFIRDRALGKKRLASMPDRVTNTIDIPGGGSALRPTVINCFDADIPSMSNWWRQWREFMFAKGLNQTGQQRHPFELLQPIERSKYPDISAEEAAVSIPLQALCLAIFDAILVHMMMQIGSDTWQPIRQDICSALNRGKNEKLMSILKSTYQDAHIIMLQETSTAFAVALHRDPVVAGRYRVLSPARTSAKRNQNSIILLDSQAFRQDSIAEVTDTILQHDEAKAISAPGDVMAVMTTTTGGQRLLLVSFHGDTNGLATKPLIAAVMQALLCEFTSISMSA